MKRGEIWTLRDSQYASKARPAVIVQADLADDFESVILVLLTTFDRHGCATRVLITPTNTNGLKETSYVMSEKLLTVRQSDLGFRVGALTADQMHEVSRQLVAVLGITADDVG